MTLRQLRPKSRVWLTAVLALSVVTSALAAVSFGPRVMKRCQLWLENRRGFPLTFQTDRLDLGGVPLTKPARFKFQFTNASEEPVEIEDVLSPCACNHASVAPRRLQPGQAGTITGALKPSFGFQDEKFLVRLRGYKLTKPLEVSAQFSNGVFAAKTLINLGRVRQGEAFEHVMGLKVEPWSPAWPELVRTQQGVVQARLVKRSGDAVDLHMTIPGTATRARSGPVGDVIEVLGRGRSPEAPLLTLAVSGEVESSIAMTPTGAFFGLRQPGRADQSINITGKAPLRIVSLRHKDPRVHLRSERLSPENSVVRVEVQSPIPGIISDEAELVLDNGEVYRFPVVGRFVAKE